MRRGLWFVAGSAVGVYGVTRVRRTAEVFSYDGVGDRLAGLFAGARLFAAEVREGAAEKESELRSRLPRLVDDRQREIGTGASLSLVPTGED